MRDNREAGVLIEVVISGIVFIKYVFHFRLRYTLSHEALHESLCFFNGRK